MCDAYCFCIAHFIGQALSNPLSDPLPKRYRKKYFTVPLLSRYQSVTQPLPGKKATIMAHPWCRSASA
jgi:hypothetical protein